MKPALAFALLALCCGCDKRGSKADAPAPTVGAPAPAPTRSPDGAGPTDGNRFIVCPGDRRCPRNKD